MKLSIIIALISMFISLFILIFAILQYRKQVSIEADVDKLEK